jgi:hypothetical protein
MYRVSGVPVNLFFNILSHRLGRERLGLLEKAVIKVSLSDGLVNLVASFSLPRTACLAA